ncbi:MAG: HD domain-containing phosphohydrolase [Chloroflexota bacterium]
MKATIRVLIVENSEEGAMPLLRELQCGGYDVVSERVETLEAMNTTLKKQAWDIVISDYTMPHFSALDALGVLWKTDLDIPFVIVSGTISEETAIYALRAGASDYVLKSNLKRLLPTVERELYEAETRREREQAEQEIQRSLLKVRKAIKGTIEATANIVEARDPYTARHQRRVAQLSVRIAREMGGVSSRQLEGIEMAALIHDIGKISVPSEILSKPTRLTQAEFDMIKTHPQIGYDILKLIDFPWPIAQIVLQHHERMDGSGYPSGISGKNILFEAKILAVADVVEAIVCHRPYRPAFTIDKALEEISRNSGILYAPDVTEACAKLFTKGLFEFE